MSKKIQRIYDLQYQHHNASRASGFAWQDESTVDYWRHLKMYQQLDPILNSDPGATWLTIGDGNYGREAHYIKEHHGISLATDLATSKLKIAKMAGYIDSYQKANAEKLPFKDNSYDYVMCKESYHHFPRPTIALYEMIRVAKKAVILIEPNDVQKRRFSWKRIWGVTDFAHDYTNRFEVSGNYVYMPSRREIEKIAYGLGLSSIAFSSIEDYYIRGIEKEKLSDKTVNYLKIRLIIFLATIARKMGIRDSSLLSIIIFKATPNTKLVNSLQNNGYQYHRLKNNPYFNE
jgi:ubiquinone/menaquinone biosynthesis C-methylase UbiE